MQCGVITTTILTQTARAGKGLRLANHLPSLLFRKRGWNIAVC